MHIKKRTIDYHASVIDIVICGWEIRAYFTEYDCMIWHETWQYISERKLMNVHLDTSFTESTIMRVELQRRFSLYAATGESY